jgi:hypothetical protein
MVPTRTDRHQGANAVASITTEHAFLRKHPDQIVGVLSCFDRLIFRGHLSLSYPRGLEGFLHQQDVLFKDFKHYAPKIAERIKEHVKGLVEQAGAPFRHLPKKERMEEEARRRVQEQGLREGIVCGFSQLETCRTYRLAYGEGRPHLKKDFRRCTVLYVFLMHPVLGLIHVKLETWFPLTMQVYANGHDLVAKKLDGLGVGYVLQDNVFLQIDDFRAAQACADRLVKQNWLKLLGALARQFNPLLSKELQGQDYYWVTDQSEYATDVVFKDAKVLATLYPRLVEHARACFSAADILKFLGRKLLGTFRGEVRTHVGTVPYHGHDGKRHEGVRVKHAMKSNLLKMYNKSPCIVRLETVINDPTEFRVRRWRRLKRGGRVMQWQPLRKGVAWLWRYAEVSRLANARYLEALAVLDDDGAVRAQLDRLTRPAKLHGQPKRALQPLSPADQALFKAVLRGEHFLRGFRNQDLAKELYRNETRNPAERRRRGQRVTRLLQLLRAHGLVAKIPRSRRYRVTAQGASLMIAAIYVRHHYLPQHLREAI